MIAADAPPSALTSLLACPQLAALELAAVPRPTVDKCPGRAHQAQGRGAPTSLFPLLRPLELRFEAWAARARDVDPTRELVEAGLQRVGRRECKRIVRGAEALLGVLGEEERQVVLMGSVVAAVREQRDLDPDAVDHLESCEGCRREPAESLAAVLDPCDLWSVGETERAEEALDRVPDALAEACSAVKREEGVRLRLAGLLLADTLGPMRVLRLAA